MSQPVAPKRARTEIFFAATLFLSAALLFTVEPMFAKMVLPLLGGAPAVWNTCLVFYQAALLAGYLYAHLSFTWLGARRQAALHLVLLGLPWFVLPIGVAEGWLPPADAFPVPWLWMLLSVSVGLPFLVVSATAPVLQTWFSRTGSQSSRDPYFLYAASNLGSLLALLAYPLVIESHWTLGEQTRGWAAGYGLLMLLIAGCAVLLWRSSPVAQSPSAAIPEPVDARPTLCRRLHWLVLSMVPSSLLLGVTTYISTDLAAIPLLWVLPLALYLLSFVFVFAKRPILPLAQMLRAQPYLIVAAAATLAWRPDLPVQLLLIGSLQLLTFFVTAMVCHGQLAGDRPAETRLTEFYLWMSLGGVLGGLFNALVAPLIFSGAVEYPLMLALACLLRPSLAPPPRGLKAWVKLALPAAVLLVCGGLTWFLRWQLRPMEWGYADVPAVKVAVLALAAVAAFLVRGRARYFGLAVAALLAMSLWYPEKIGSQLLHAERSFFGVLRVMESPLWNAHELLHGSTCHGSQSLGQHERHDPWAYYNREGPLGRIFQALQPRRPLAEIGVLGLGAGAIAAYGQPGERITFYEIDPAVERIARNPQYFTYLADSRAKVEVVLGDARLSLIHGPPHKFDLLVVDVFSSDSVPIHLISHQAMKIYLDRLNDHGLLAIHVTNRYLELKPIFGRLAKAMGVAAKICVDGFARGGIKRFPSDWVVISRRAEDLAPFTEQAAWKPLRTDGGRVWTDDFSNVVDAAQWQLSEDWWMPSQWWPSQKSSPAAYHSSIGVLLCEQGRSDEGMAQFQKALKIDPNLAEAHYNLGNVLARLRRFDDAAAQFRQALKIAPDDPKAYNNLATAMQCRDQIDETIARFERIVESEPGNVRVHSGLGNALGARGRLSEAIAQYQIALKIAPDDLDVQNHLAWLWATCPDAALRNSARAIELAERANRQSGGKQAAVLDTLAAAYAAAARFPQAVATACTAQDIAHQQNNKELADALQARIALYEAGKPYREAASVFAPLALPKP
jgi:tetratricopeptide (TPR) repeat protein